MTSHSEEPDQTPEQMLLALKKDMVSGNGLNCAKTNSNDNLTDNLIFNEATSTKQNFIRCFKFETSF